MAIVTDLKTLKTTFAGKTDWIILESRANQLARHYRATFGWSWQESTRQAWEAVKSVACECSYGFNTVSMLAMPALLRRKAGW